MIKKFILIFFILTVAVSAQTPIDYNKWDHGDSVYSMQLGGALSNYNDGTGWRAISCNLINNGGIYSCTTDVLTNSITDEGVSTITLNWGGEEYTITQELIGLRWYRLSDSAWINIDMSPDWSNLTQTTFNKLYWTGVFPGVDYELEKTNARVAHRIIYKPKFLDSMVTLYDQRSDSSDIYLANIMKYSLSNNIDNYNQGMGNVNKRVLKELGSFLFSINEQFADYNHPIDTNDYFKPRVKQRWEKQQGKIYMGEFVKASHLKLIHTALPTTAIWHNDDFTIGGTAATHIDDARLDKQKNDWNYGAHTDLKVGDDFAPGSRFNNIIIRFNTLDDSMRNIGTVASWDSAFFGLTIDALQETNESLCVTWHKVTDNSWEEGVSTGADGCGVTWDSTNREIGGSCPGTAGAWKAGGGDFNSARETNGNHPDSMWFSPDDWSLDDTAYFYMAGTTIEDTMGNKSGIIIQAIQYVDSDNDNAIIFDSGDQTSRRPFLKVWYTAGEPGGGAIRGQVIPTIIID